MEIIITYMVVAIGTSAICSICEAALSSTPMPYVSMLEGKSGAAQGIDESTFIGIISAIFTVLVLMCSEILPKTIGANYWKSLILTMVKVIKCMIWITYPLVWILDFITRMLSNEDATAMTREEIAAVGKAETCF